MDYRSGTAQEENGLLVFPVTSLIRQAYYAAFMKYYTQTLQPIGKYIGMTRTQRGVTLEGMTDYAKSTHYAYDWGLDCQLLERAIDELGDIQTGISFIRGAARQYSRCWGIDISEFRVAGDGATSFSNTMRLTNGWSPSYLKRHMYISYMNGAHAVYMEPADYYTNGQLNPLGQTLREFGNFALIRHPDVGTTVVPMAMMLDFSHGFEPKFGYYVQSDDVWNQDLPYQDGDYMTYNMLNTLFPGFRMHGRTPNAPWGEPDQSGKRNTQGYLDFLAKGGDPRPYEPIAPSRWGDQFDVILNNASADTLAKYKVITLVGNIVISDTLRPRLQQWVQNGGTLVVTGKQVTKSDQSLLGVTLTGEARQGGDAQWLADQTRYTEPAYTYTVVTPTSAAVIARNSAGDPLITKNSVGAGTVYFATPDYMQSNDKNTALGSETTQLLNIGVRLLDTLITPLIPVQVQGQPILYTVNQGPDKTVILLSNNTGNTWSGELSVKKPSGSYTVQEWTTDTLAASRDKNGQVTITASVPPYDLRIYAITYPPGTMTSGGSSVVSITPLYAMSNGGDTQSRYFTTVSLSNIDSSTHVLVNDHWRWQVRSKEGGSPNSLCEPLCD